MELKKKWVIFDAMGVVFTQAHIVKKILGPFIQQYNSRVNLEYLQRLYQEITLGNITSTAFWTELGLGKHYPRIEDEYLTENIILDLDFIPTAKELKKNYHLGMISNDAKDWAKKIHQFYQLDRYFDCVIISAEVHARKPDPLIYKEFLEQAQTSPSNCIFIDDKIENLRTAAELGFNTILYIPKEPIELTNTTFTPSGSTNDLVNIPDILKNINF